MKGKITLKEAGNECRSTHTHDVDGWHVETRMAGGPGDGFLATVAGRFGWSDDRNFGRTRVAAIRAISDDWTAPVAEEDGGAVAFHAFHALRSAAL